MSEETQDFPTSDGEPTVDVADATVAVESQDSAGGSDGRSPQPGSDDGGQKPKKKLLVPVLAGIAAVAVIAFCGYYFLYHEWSPATCTEPETCGICGRANGEALGHDWEDATCTDPKACSRCGEVEGEALGHDWKDATCTVAKTCERCGETQGEPLGHDVTTWTTDKEATCTEEGSQSCTCNRCEQVVTESLPMVEHTAGDWQITQDITLSTYGEIQPGVETQYCMVCGKELDTRDYTIEASTQLKNACKQAMQKIRSNHPSYKGLIEELYEYEGFTEEEATFAADHCGADWNEQAKLRAEDLSKYEAYSRSGLIDWLMTYDLFTSEEANYAADQMGL